MRTNTELFGYKPGHKHTDRHTRTYKAYTQHVNCAYAMWPADASTNNKNNNNTEMLLLKV